LCFQLIHVEMMGTPLSRNARQYRQCRAFEATATVKGATPTDPRGEGPDRRRLLPRAVHPRSRRKSIRHCPRAAAPLRRKVLAIPPSDRAVARTPPRSFGAAALSPLLIRIERNSRYPNMWRIVRPDGSLTDMVNMTRAKDASYG
jgi:hypothetical protein